MEQIGNQVFGLLCSAQFLKYFFFGGHWPRTFCAFMNELSRSRQYSSMLQSYRFQFSLSQTYSLKLFKNAMHLVEDIKYVIQENLRKMVSTGFCLLNEKDIGGKSIEHNIFVCI